MGNFNAARKFGIIASVIVAVALVAVFVAAVVVAGTGQRTKNETPLPMIALIAVGWLVISVLPGLIGALLLHKHRIWGVFLMLVSGGWFLFLGSAVWNNATAKPGQPLSPINILIVAVMLLTGVLYLLAALVSVFDVRKVAKVRVPLPGRKGKGKDKKDEKKTEAKPGGKPEGKTEGKPPEKEGGQHDKPPARPEGKPVAAGKAPAGKKK